MFQHKYVGLDIGKYHLIKRRLERVGNRPEVKTAYGKTPKGSMHT